jgi:hypothetical protein
MDAFEHARCNKICDCLAYGDSADTQANHQGPFGRNRLARVELGVDEFLEDAADLRALGGSRRSLTIKVESHRQPPHRLVSAPAGYSTLFLPYT